MVVCSSANLSLRSSAFPAISVVTPDNFLPRSTISPMRLLPSESSGADDCHDLPNASAPNAARCWGSSIALKISDNCLNASSGSFAVMPSALNFSAFLPIFMASLLIAAAVPSRSAPDCVAASFRPAKSSMAIFVVTLKSLRLSAASIEPFRGFEMPVTIQRARERRR